jgi:hypothetical protein
MRQRAAKLVRVDDGVSIEYRGEGRQGVGVVHFPFRHE